MKYKIACRTYRDWNECPTLCESYLEIEAVRLIASMRKSYRVNPKRSRKINRETLKDMIKKGYTYKGIARETGLAESTVEKKGFGLWLEKALSSNVPSWYKSWCASDLLEHRNGRTENVRYYQQSRKGFWV